MSCVNDFGSFCANQNIVNEANLAGYISRVGQVPPLGLPMPAVSRPCPRAMPWSDDEGIAYWYTDNEIQWASQARKHVV